ncbi:MAG: translocation/assembly module TamB domain-containing protein [Candidatus Latescibacterota bacterium]|nr:translocation/assembly module TamB domain-containing protein [Candidatus Latescibacterota bacterium]
MVANSVLFAIALFTPLIPHLAVRWISSDLADSGWTVTVDEVSGSPAVGATFTGARAQHPLQGIEIHVDSLRFDLLDWKLHCRGPVVVLTERSASSNSSQPSSTDSLRLSWQNWPDLRLRRGRLEVRAGESLTAQLDSLEARFTSTNGAVHLAGRLHWPQASGDTLRGAFTTDWRVHDDRVSWIEGDISLSGASSTARLHPVAELKLDKQLSLVAALRTSLVAGQARSNVELTTLGQLRPLQLNLQLAGAIQTPSLSPMQLKGSARVDARRFDLDSLHLESNRVTLTGSLFADWSTGRYRGAIDLSQLEISSFMTGADGTLTGSLRVDGSLNGRPAATIDLRTANLAGLAAETLQLQLRARLDSNGALTGVAEGGERLGHVDFRGHLDLLSARPEIDLFGVLRLAPWTRRSAEAEVSGRLQGDTLKVRLTAASLPYGVPAIAESQLDLTLTGYRRLAATASLHAGRVQLTGTADLREGRIDSLRGRIEDLALGSFVAPLSADLNGDFHVSGDFAALRGQAEVGVKELRVDRWDAGSSTLRVRVDSDQMEVRLNGDHFQAHARIDSHRVATQLQMTRLELLRFRRRHTDTVRVVGCAEAIWDLPSNRFQQLSTRLDSAVAMVWGRRTAAAGIGIDYRGTQGELHPVTVQTPFGDVDLHGSLNGDRLQVRASGGDLRLAGIGPLRGRGGVELEIDGPLSALSGHLTSRLDSLRFGSHSLGKAWVDARIDADEFDADLKLATSGGGRLDLTLRVPAEAWLDSLSNAEARLDIVVDSLRTGALLSYLVADSSEGLLSGTGRLSIPAHDLFTSDSWRRLRGRGLIEQLELRRGSVAAILQEPAAASFKDGRLTLDQLALPVQTSEISEEQRGQIRLDGHVGLDGNSMELDVEELNLDAIAAALPGSGVALPDGALSAAVRFAGSLRQPVVVGEAHLELDDLGHVDASTRLSAAGWEARSTWVTFTEDSVRATLFSAVDSTGIPVWETAQGALHSDGIDLLVFLDQLPNLDYLTGRVSSDVLIDRFAPEFTARGTIGIEDLDLALLDTRPLYRIPRGQLQVIGNRAELIGFEGGALGEDGSFSLGGFADVGKSVFDWQLALLTRDLPYRFDDVFDARVDLDLVLQPIQGGSHLSGEVVMRDAVVEAQILKLDAADVPAPPAVPSPAFEATSLDVSIDVRNLQSVSELSDVVISGNTRVYGSLSKPLFQGEMVVKEGRILVLNRDFQFRRGRIILDKLVPTYSLVDIAFDPILLDPEIDLEAFTLVQPIQEEEEEREVVLAISGSALRPNPLLTSAGLVDQQVIGLLAFGSLEPAEYDYEGALLTVASQLFLGRQVARVGLDEFMLLPSSKVGGEGHEKAIRVGKFFSSPIPVWLRYEALTRDPSLGRLEMEYHIAKFLTVEASTHSQYEVYGLGIGLKKSF